MTERGKHHGIRNRGVAVLLVLIALAMATILSMSFLNSQGTSLGIAKNIEDEALARGLAESTLDMAIEYIRGNSSGWRSEQSSGVYASGPTFGTRGRTTICFRDSDDDLQDDEFDSVELVATGLVGLVRHTSRAIVEVAPGQVGTVLLVVPEAVSEDELRNFHYMDWLRKVYLESWDFTVILVDDSESQAELDALVDQADCAYVAGTVDPAQLGMKLADASIGVVCEHGELAAEFGFSSSYGAYAGDAVQVVDTSHYITEPLDAERYTLLESDDALHTVSGTISADLHVLAEHPGDGRPMLAVLDAGAATHTGSRVPGRRVFMPWNDDGVMFEMARLNATAQLLMRRAAIWASKPVLPGDNPSGRLISSWSFEESSGAMANDDVSGHHGAYKLGCILGQSGRFGNAVRYNGSNSYVLVGHHVDFLLDQGSLSFWFNSADPGRDQAFISKDSGMLDTGGHLDIRIDNPPYLQVRLQSTTVDDYYVNAPMTIMADTWYHVVFTFGPEGMQLFINGSLVDTNAYTGGMSGPSSGGEDGNLEPMVFGASTYLSNDFVESPLYRHAFGLIDEVQIYDYQLTAAEVSALYRPARELMYLVTYLAD